MITTNELYKEIKKEAKNFINKLKKYFELEDYFEASYLLETRAKYLLHFWFKIKDIETTFSVFYEEETKIWEIWRRGAVDIEQSTKLDDLIKYVYQEIKTIKENGVKND